MWVVAEYEPTSLFSLRPSVTTASGGRSLPLPTPFAVKMALLDIICRNEGESVGRQYWPILRDSVVALRPAKYAVISHTMNRVLKPPKTPDPAKPMAPTVGYREYVYLGGTLGIALLMPDAVDLSQLCVRLSCIQYLGKRGSFVQLQSPPDTTKDLPAGFIVIDGVLSSLSEVFGLDELMLELDDTGASATFDRVNIYSDTALRQSVDRVTRSVVLPYRVVSSSQRYTYFSLQGAE